MRILKDVLSMVGILCLSFCLCFVIQYTFDDSVLIPAIVVLGVFLTSVVTQEYIYGIIASLISVFAVNFAFTVPFFELDFTIPENIISAAILLIVAVVTSGFTTDIKRHEAIKTESERERMRANLLRAVSHDLRTPLTTIYGSSRALLENYGDFSDEQKIQILKGISEDSEWLSRMVENLLSITKLDSGNVNIIKTETVLDELVDAVLVKFAKRYPEQEVLVDIPDEFVVIPMDAILIEQVAINILDNAARHAKGMTTLAFKVTVSGGKAVFEIKDDGCGIDEDKLKNIFRGGNLPAETPADGGRSNAGIGLSVCASIIKAHGGEIRAKNRKKGGCKFIFTLDMGEADDE